MYPELKINSVVLWQCPVFAIYLVQTLIMLQGNMTEVSVCTFSFFLFFFLSFFLSLFLSLSPLSK